MKVDGDGTARVEFEVRFPAASRRRQARPKTESPTPPLLPVPPQVSKDCQMLVLGYHFERLVSDGVVNNYVEIARLTGLSRARVTQITDLTLLSPRIQEQVLLHNEGHPRTRLAEGRPLLKQHFRMSAMLLQGPRRK